VREALEKLKSAGLDLDTLSMGMSGDLEAAIQEGATIIRVGTALFGPRAP
jgi:PLP dependent protein